MHSKREYATAAAKGIIVSGLLGLLISFLGQVVFGDLLPWPWIVEAALSSIFCAIAGGAWQVVRLKREDSRAKQANINTALDVLAQSILSEEE